MNRALKRAFAALLALLVLLGPIVTARAQVELRFTDAQRRMAREYGTLYIAGSLDALPMEGLENGVFVGVMPELYRKLSELTGMRFVYVHSAADRYTLAENRQCDILSLVTEDEAALYARGLLPGPVCFRYAGTEYRIAYTQRLPAELAAMLNAALEQLPDAAYAECAVAGAAALYAARAPLWMQTALWILSGLCALLLLLLVLSVIRSRRNIKKARHIHPVTGLYTWCGFSERFAQLRKQHRYPLYFLAYIWIDCERESIFSEETALRARMEAVAQALREKMQPGCFAAHAEGFQFILCFAPGSQSDAAGALEAILDAMEEAINRAEGVRRAMAYAGLCRADATQGRLDMAIRETRIAAWSAREQGQRILNGSEKVTRSATMDYRTAQEILAAVDMEAFYVYVLPRVELSEAKVAGGQALVRWKHPSRGLLSPRDFLPYIERTEKIKEMDLRVFSQACAWSERRRKNGFAPMLITCNLSDASLGDPAVCDELMELLARHGVLAGELGVEVDSGMLKSGAADARANIERLHAAGVSVVLDKFGGDATSLGALTEYAVDMVKIHASLLPEGSENEDVLRSRLRLLNNTINLCKKLGFRIVCSGVESGAQHTIVCRLGCDFAEGFHYFRPLPCDGFDENFAGPQEAAHAAPAPGAAKNA